MNGIVWIGGTSLVALVITTVWWRRRSRSRFLKATALVRMSHEFWEIATNVPSSHLSRPLREAIGLVFASIAERLATGPMAAYGATLAQRSAEIHKLPRMSDPRLSEGAEERFVRLVQLLDAARLKGLLPIREHALARVAAGLSAELSEIDGLCLKAERALTLRSYGEAMQFRRQALGCCSRLPNQTGTEARRRIEARLPLAADS